MQAKIKVISLLSILIFFSSCDQSSKREVTLSFDKVCLDISGNELSLYSTADLQTTSNSTLLYGYNRFSNKIDKFDIEKRKVLEKLDLNFEDPEAIIAYENFGLIDGKIWIKSKFKFIELTEKPKIYNLEKDIQIFKNGFSKEKHIFIPPTFGGLDADRSGNIYLKLFFENGGASIAYLNLPKYEAGLVPFKNPIENLNAYSYKKYPNLEVIDNDSLLINYNFSSKIYIFDQKSGKSTVYNVPSDYTLNETPPLKNEEMNDTKTTVRYHLNELNFFGVKYDRFRNIYLRVHQDKRETSGEPQTLYLSIISKDFKKIKEIKLPDSVKPYFEIGRQGIYFPLETINESQLCFSLMSIN